MRKGRAPSGARPSWPGEGGPLPMRGAAQPLELGFPKFPVLHRGGKSTGCGAADLRLTSVSPQACPVHLLSLRYSLPFQPQSYSGDQNRMQFNCIKSDSLKRKE